MGLEGEPGGREGGVGAGGLAGVGKPEPHTGAGKVLFSLQFVGLLKYVVPKRAWRQPECETLDSGRVDLPGHAFLGSKDT